MKKKNVFRDWAAPVIVALSVAFLMFFLCWPVRVDGISMRQSYEAGDRLFISRIMAMLSDLHRGDVVAAKAVINEEEKLILKRIIAVPGDTIKITQGLVYLNGKLIEEDYTTGYTYGEIECTLMKGEYFIMGDNRANSTDSRVLGVINRSDIVGKAIMRWFPFNKIGLTQAN